MITVYGSWEAWGVADWSPACLKLKTYLKMEGIEYESKQGDPRKAPTKKIPYIDDGKGNLIGDSGVIIEHLKKTLGDKLDARLSPSERAMGHAARRIVENSLYFVLLYSQWFEEASYAEIRKTFKRILPPVIGGLIMGQIRSNTQKIGLHQGIAKLPTEAIYRAGAEDLDALSTMLGDKTYLLGDALTSYDATVYAHLTIVLCFPVKTPLEEYAKSKANLVPYCKRITDKYWSLPPAQEKEKEAAAQ
jgi:glutathione S-transferase